MNIRAESVIRCLLIGICMVATGTGLNIILQGVSGIPESGLISQASVDNELRFMTVFWIAFGVYCYSISKNVNENRTNILYVAIIFFCSGLARLLSYVSVGEPIGLFVGAMALELCLPVVIFGLVKSISSTENQPQQI